MDIHTKFSVGETAFFLHQNEVCNAEVTRITFDTQSGRVINQFNMKYRKSFVKLEDERCFRTKEELLKSL